MAPDSPTGRFMRLAELYRDYRELALPRSGALASLEDADIDLYEEDAYLAGLVATALGSSRLPQAQIWTDASIDARLARARAGSPEEAAVIAGLKRYRRAMAALGEELSRATGVPRRDKSLRGMDGDAAV